MRRTLPRLRLLAASVTGIQCQLSELPGLCSRAVPGPDCVPARQRLAGDSEEEVTERQKQS